MGLFDNVDLSKFNNVIKEGIEEGKKESGSFEELPPGLYHAKVVSIEVGHTKETNKLKATWTFGILNEGFENRKHWETIVLEHYKTDENKNTILDDQGNPILDEEKTRKGWGRFFRAINVFFDGVTYEDGTPVIISDISDLRDDIVEYYIIDKECSLNITVSSSGGRFVNIGSVSALDAH